MGGMANWSVRGSRWPRQVGWGVALPVVTAFYLWVFGAFSLAYEPGRANVFSATPQPTWRGHREPRTDKLAMPPIVARRPGKYHRLGSTAGGRFLSTSSARTTRMAPR